MTSLTSAKLGEVPRVSGNILQDVIDYIKMGDCVVLHVNYKTYPYIFHQCGKKKEESKSASSSITSLNGGRVIYVNVVLIAEKLLKKKWADVITRSGCKLCSCVLKGRVTNPYKVQGHHVELSPVS